MNRKNDWQHLKAVCCVFLSVVLFWGSPLGVYAEESSNMDTQQENSMLDIEQSDEGEPEDGIQTVSETEVKDEKQTEENAELEIHENTSEDQREQSKDVNIKEVSVSAIKTKTVSRAKVNSAAGFTGLMKQSDGVWRYLINGVVQNTYTGLVKHSTGTWYYVEDGIVQFDVTGLVKHSTGTWYYVKDGKMQSGFSGMLKHNTGIWYYVEKGKVQNSYTGLAKHITGSWYYVKKGEVQFDVTGLVKHSTGTWYYVKDGKMQSSYKGFVKHTTGTWYYIEKGKMQSGYTGLAKHVTGKWYYVEDGKWQKTFNGLVKYNGKFYTVKQGLKAGNGKTAGQLSTNELRSASQSIAKDIASDAKKYSSDKWDQAAYAASRVYGYCSNSRYTTQGSNYSQPWGPFVIGEYSCAGSTRALGLVLDYLGISWSHTNPNQWTHQWCTIRINGEKGWADGMIGLAGTGEYPFI